MEAVTPQHEILLKSRVLKPWHAVDLQGMGAVNMGINTDEKIYPYSEISRFPLLHFKKYYPGCLKEAKSVLIKRLGGMGDVVWTLPIAAKIKQYNKDIKVGYLVDDRNMALLENNPHIDEVHLYPLTVDKIMDYDFVFDAFETIERYNPAEYEEAYDIHYKWAFNKLPDIDVLGQIYLTEDEKLRRKKAFGEDYILISLSASNPKRTWFMWNALMGRILEETDKDIIITGMLDLDLMSHKRVKNLNRQTSLRELYALVEGAGAVVCTDSGAMHIAGQFKRPCVALFTTVRAETRAKYYPSVVSIDTPLSCGGCVKLGEGCPIEGECCSAISPADVWNKLKGVI